MTETSAPAEGLANDYPFMPMPADEAVQRMQDIISDRPMTKVHMPIGGEAWAIHRHSVAREMLTDPRFVRKPFREREREVPNYVQFPQFLLDTMQFADPPEHTKLRRLVQVAISPRRVKVLHDRTVAFARSLLEDMSNQGNRGNLIDAYGMQLPILVLSELLGVPAKDREQFIEWSGAALAVGTMDEAEVKRNFEELYAYLIQLIAQRREKPEEDLLSSLANARDKDDSLTDAEIMPIAMILLVAGFDNTANFIGTGVHALLRNDDQRMLLLEDIDGRINTAVEEILRHGMLAEGRPVAGGGGFVAFVATEDVVLDGVTVKEGEAVFIDPNSVNHDQSVFPEAEKFDITRKENPHMMLSYGLHHCLGAPLARMELQIGIAEVFRRFPNLKLDGEVEHNYNLLTQPMTLLPVSW